MPGYEDEVDNETISKAAEALHSIGIEVYNADGSFQDLDTTLGQLAVKWDGLTSAQQAYISYQVAATRQSNKFRSILMAYTDATDLATEATNANGNALENQEKYNESYVGQMQSIRTEMDTFWLKFWNSDTTHIALSGIDGLLTGLNELADATHPVVAGIVAIGTAITGLTLGKMGLNKISASGGRAKKFVAIRKLITHQGSCVLIDN